MRDHAGQAGIRFRMALLDGDVAAMEAALPDLDDAHRIELVLGGALRDAREGHAAAHAYARGHVVEACRRLVGIPDHSLDDRAAALVAARMAPERWQPRGTAAVAVKSMEDAAAALSSGVGGEALLEAMSQRALHGPVSYYYRIGTIHALGVRPLLVLVGAHPEGSITASALERH